MIVTLDGRRLDDSFTANCTLTDLIDRVRRDHLDDRLVVAVAVNGEPWGDEQLAAALEQTLGEDVQVDLESSDRCQLAAEALRSVAERLEAAQGELPALAQRLSGGEVAAAVREVAEVVGVWQTCGQTIVQCSQLLGRDLTQLAFAGEPMQTHLSRLTQQLGVVRDALEARDMVLLADVVRYELPTPCDTWRDLLRDLAEQVAESA